MSSSISTRLITVLSLCTTLIVGLGMTLDYQLSRNAILERMQLQADETIDTMVSDLENLLDGVEGSTRFLGRILQQRQYSQDGLRQMLQDIVENNADIFGAAIALNPELADEATGFAAYYFQRDGILSYSDLSTTQGQYWLQAWYADAVNAGKPVWVEPYFDRGGGNVWMTTFSVPVYRFDEDGKRFLYAVVTADITLEELHHYLQNMRLGNSGVGILLSSAGSVLSSGNPDSTMQSLFDATGSKIKPSRWQEIRRALLMGQEHTGTIDCPGGSGTCKVRLGALQSTGWPVGVIYSEDEVLAPLREFELKAAALGFATLLLMALAVYAVTRRITHPLTALARASSDIAQGKLNTVLPAARGNDEVARLVQSFGAMKQDLKSYIADLEAATASRGRLEGELAAAREIQMSMLPGGGEASELTPEYELWARVRPAKSVGGDLYSYYRSGNQLFLAVGDVSDKGVPAALFMARAISLLQQLTNAESAPATAMGQLNNALEAGNDNCMFVTLFLAVLDLDTLQLRFASAGHPPPSLLRSARVTVLAQDDGAALGLAPDLNYPENTLQLQPGDRLAIYTDGIDEAFNEQAAMFGVERFNTCLQETGTMSACVAGPAVFQAIDNFAGDMPQSDDITLMLLQLQPHSTGLSATMRFTGGEQLTSRLLRWLQDAMAGMGIAQDEQTVMSLVAEEIVTNVDKYGQLPPAEKIQVTVEKAENSVSLEVRDPGRAFDPLREARLSPLGAETDHAEIGGLGVHLVTQLTDQQEYRRADGHNILRVVKLLQDQDN
jgi:sigma-B regulation protein RsbU (phosphoserine phosphatase)